MHEREVAEVLELKLDDLVAGHSMKRLVRRGIAFKTDVYEVGAHMVWGATARILADLLLGPSRRRSAAAARRAGRRESRAGSATSPTTARAIASPRRPRARRRARRCPRSSPRTSARAPPGSSIAARSQHDDRHAVQRVHQRRRSGPGRRRRARRPRPRSRRRARRGSCRARRARRPAARAPARGRGSRRGRSGPAPLGLDVLERALGLAEPAADRRSAPRSSARRRRSRSAASTSGERVGFQSRMSSAERFENTPSRIVVTTKKTIEAAGHDGEDVHAASVGCRSDRRPARVGLPDDPRSSSPPLPPCWLCAPAAAAAELPMRVARATRRPRRCVRILTPGSSAPCPGSGSAAVARALRRRALRARETGGYEVARSRARAFADALRERDLLVYAQPTRCGARPRSPTTRSPGAQRLAPERRRPGADAAAGGAREPADRARRRRRRPHPRRVDRATRTSPRCPGRSSRARTARRRRRWPRRRRTAIGILGVWPGARALNVPLPTVPGTEGLITCDASGDAIAQAVESGAAVINMSYGSRSRCVAEWVQIYFAVAKGIIPVAAAGNEFERRQPARVPGLAAARRHRRRDDARTTRARRSPTPTTRSTSARPASGILTAVPPALDTDGAQDGYQALDGTSFSAPMVSAALAWVRAARPELTARPRDPGRAADARATSCARLGPADRLRRPQRRRRAGGAGGQAPDPPIRSSPTTTSRGSTGAASAEADKPVWSGGGVEAPQRRCWTSRRTRSTSTGS